MSRTVGIPLVSNLLRINYPLVFYHKFIVMNVKLYFVFPLKTLKTLVKDPQPCRFK